MPIVERIAKPVVAMALAGVVGGFSGHYMQTQTSVPSDATVEVINVGEGLGSGVAVKPGYVLTANHVVDGAKAVKVMRKDGTQADAHVLWQDKEHDVAAVGFSPKFVTGVSDVACDYKAAIGDSLEAIGMPTGMLFVHSWGRVAGLESSLTDADAKESYWPDFFIADLNIDPGNSGGPVYGSDGRVVGLAVGERILPVFSGIGAVGAGFAFVVPSYQLCASMKEHAADDLPTAINREINKLKSEPVPAPKKDVPTPTPTGKALKTADECTDAARVSTVIAKAEELKRNIVKYEGDNYKKFVLGALTAMPDTPPSLFNDFDAAYIADTDGTTDNKFVFLAKDGCVTNYAMVPSSVVDTIEKVAAGA